MADDLPFQKGDEVGLMINGLGGTPPSESFLLYRRAAVRCSERGSNVVHNYVGNYCTSLEMAGFSLTLIRLDAELKRLSKRPPTFLARLLASSASFVFLGGLWSWVARRPPL